MRTTTRRSTASVSTPGSAGRAQTGLARKRNGRMARARPDVPAAWPGRGGAPVRRGAPAGASAVRLEPGASGRGLSLSLALVWETRRMSIDVVRSMSIFCRAPNPYPIGAGDVCAVPLAMPAGFGDWT